MNSDLGPTLFLILLIAPTLVYDFYYFVKHRKNKDKLPTFSDYWLFYYSKKGWVMNFRRSGLAGTGQGNGTPLVRNCRSLFYDEISLVTNKSSTSKGKGYYDV